MPQQEKVLPMHYSAEHLLLIAANAESIFALAKPAAYVEGLLPMV
jgi:hypothetical protein